MKHLSALCTCALAAFTLTACSQKVISVPLQDALTTTHTAHSMYRGVDYLGTADGYHYFEIKKELAGDIRFRVSATEYTPKQQIPYRAWFPQRIGVETEWANMVLGIWEHDNHYRYIIAGQVYHHPAEIPTHAWAAIRVVNLPSKQTRINNRAIATITPYLPKQQKIYYYPAISGITPLEQKLLHPHAPENAGQGAINSAAMDALFEKSAPPSYR